MIAPGLVDRIAVHEGSRWFDSHRPNDFPDPIDQDIRTQCALSWKIVISVIAVSMNVGGGVHKTVHVHSKKHYKHNEDGRTAPGMRCHGSVPLSYSGTSLRELDYNNKNDERNKLFVKVGSLPSFMANIASHEIPSIIHVIHNIGLVGRLFWV